MLSLFSFSFWKKIKQTQTTWFSWVSPTPEPSLGLIFQFLDTISCVLFPELIPYITEVCVGNYPHPQIFPLWELFSGLHCELCYQDFQIWCSRVISGNIWLPIACFSPPCSFSCSSSHSSSRSKSCTTTRRRGIPCSILFQTVMTAWMFWKGKHSAHLHHPNDLYFWPVFAPIPVFLQPDPGVILCAFTFWLLKCFGLHWSPVGPFLDMKIMLFYLLFPF